MEHVTVKKKLADLAKQHNLDAIHEHLCMEMCKDEARHGAVRLRGFCWTDILSERENGVMAKIDCEVVKCSHNKAGVCYANCMEIVGKLGQEGL